jgi:hypothetical protein
MGVSDAARGFIAIIDGPTWAAVGGRPGTHIGGPIRRCARYGASLAVGQKCASKAARRSSSFRADHATVRRWPRRSELMVSSTSSRIARISRPPRADCPQRCEMLRSAPAAVPRETCTDHKSRTHTMTMENPAVTVSDADLIRVRLQAAELSQREAAQQLGIDVRTMRRYCAGSEPVPPLLFLALDRLGQIWRYNRVVEMLDDGTMSTSDGPLTREQFEHRIEVLRQANDKLLRAINFLGGEPDLSGTTNGLDTFDTYLRHQGMDPSSMPEEQVRIMRAAFESGKARRETARSAVFFNQPCPAGEYRYAVAIEDRSDLRLALVVRRSRKGEYFVLMPRDGDWNPHASYHLDGRFHHKSHDQVLMPEPKLRQRLDQFKGTEHLGMLMGFGTTAPICNPANFTSVLELPPGILESMHGCVLVDLVEPGVAPNPLHRQNHGMRITHEETYRDGWPWVVIAVAAQQQPTLNSPA